MEDNRPSRRATRANGAGAEPHDISHVDSSVEEVALTVPTTDDPSLPVMTFRMWVLGVTSCFLLMFLNTFFSYRTQPLAVSATFAQIAVLPIGRFLAAVLPRTQFRMPILGTEFSLNPGPFNMKEHALITIFANAGVSFGGGDAYSVGAINIMKAFYKKNVHFITGLLIVLTTQVLGYGWAGIFRRYLVEPPHMWWPSNLVQVSLFRCIQNGLVTLNSLVLFTFIEGIFLKGV